MVFVKHFPDSYLQPINFISDLKPRSRLFWLTYRRCNPRKRYSASAIIYWSMCYVCAVAHSYSDELREQQAQQTVPQHLTFDSRIKPSKTQFAITQRYLSAPALSVLSNFSLALLPYRIPINKNTFFQEIRSPLRRPWSENK